MRAMQVNSPPWRGSARTFLAAALASASLAMRVHRQVQGRLVRPGDKREQDAALGAADDRLDDPRVFERLGDALHLQLVARLVDRIRYVDGDDQRRVDLLAGDGHSQADGGN